MEAACSQTVGIGSPGRLRLPAAPGVFRGLGLGV